MYHFVPKNQKSRFRKVKDGVKAIIPPAVAEPKKCFACWAFDPIVIPEMLAELQM